MATLLKATVEKPRHDHQNVAIKHSIDVILLSGFNYRSLVDSSKLTFAEQVYLYKYGLIIIIIIINIIYNANTANLELEKDFFTKEKSFTLTHLGVSIRMERSIFNFLPFYKIIFAFGTNVLFYFGTNICQIFAGRPANTLPAAE